MAGIDVKEALVSIFWAPYPNSKEEARREELDVFILMHTYCKYHFYTIPFKAISKKNNTLFKG